MSEHPEEETEELAKDRTDLAEDRTIMAVERTFASWMSTAFGAIAIGLGFKALFSALEPLWLPKTIASLFILLGAVFAISAERRARRALTRLSSNKVDPPDLPNLKWVAYAVATGAIVLVVAIWLLLDSQKL